MADEKKTVQKDEGAQASKPKKQNKFIAFFRNLPRNIATPFKNMWHELKKVTWPTRKDLINYTCIVLVFMVFMGVVIGLLDMGASRLVTAISSLKHVETTEEVVTDDEGGDETEADAQEPAESTDAPDAAADEADAADDAQEPAESTDAPDDAATEAPAAQ